MALLEQTTVVTPLFQSPPSDLDEPIVEALATVPFAVGIAITESESGLRAILVHDAPPDEVEVVEDAAMSRILDVRDRFRRHVDLIALSRGEAAGITIPSSSRAYSLPR